jgi:hypothetical protein
VEDNAHAINDMNFPKADSDPNLHLDGKDDAAKPLISKVSI